MAVVDFTEDGSTDPLSRPCDTRTARFGLHRPTSDTAILSADGEIDAANADHLGDYALQVAGDCRYLVLDLSGVEFFGTDGFSTLHTLNVRCAEAGVRWVMVPSMAVNRVLRICDPRGGLRAADTLDAALDAVHGEQRGLLQLVPR
jgi:anti-anti-sigma factor